MFEAKHLSIPSKMCITFKDTLSHLLNSEKSLSVKNTDKETLSPFFETCGQEVCRWAGLPQAFKEISIRRGGVALVFTHVPEYQELLQIWLNEPQTLPPEIRFVCQNTYAVKSSSFVIFPGHQEEFGTNAPAYESKHFVNTAPGLPSELYIQAWVSLSKSDTSNEWYAVPGRGCIVYENQDLKLPSAWHADEDHIFLLLECKMKDKDMLRRYKSQTVKSGGTLARAITTLPTVGRVKTLVGKTTNPTFRESLFSMILPPDKQTQA